MIDPHREKLLGELADRVGDMRRLQRAYFAGDKSRETLHAAKRAEHAVDKLLEELKTPAGQQGRLF